MAMTEKKLSINTDNILPIIKQWLYADKEVFLRELVANAQDAIAKRKIVYTSDYSDKISITIDKEKKTLTLTDTGIGMTEEEIEKYIAQIAFSGAEEFAKQYQNGKESIIGHFGLGFYSSYMVASSVEIFSKSFKEGSQGAYWRCDGGTDYTLSSIEREEKGTSIVLHIAEDAQEFLEPEKIKGLLKKYCQFFPVQLEVDGQAFTTYEPLWLKGPQTLSSEDYLNFYKILYPFDEEPLFWVHINIDYPYHVKGVLYFPKIAKNYDFQKSHISLYSSRVFVSSDCKDLLPDYLTVLKGCIDSPDIPLNVSRSYLQMDKNVRSLSSHISKKVTGVLHDKFQTDRASFEKNFEDIETVLKLGLLQDEKLFEKLEPFYLLKTTQGTFETLKEATDLKEDKILYYTQDLYQHKNLLELFNKKHISVYLLNSPLDSACLNILEEKGKCKFSRLDGQIPETLFEDAECSIDSIKEFFPDLEVKIKGFDSKALPGMFIIDESMRRFKEYMQLTRQQGLDKLDQAKQIVLNKNNPLVQRLLSAETKELSLALSGYIKNLICLSQNLFDQKDLAQFVEDSSLLFEKISQSQGVSAQN